jgi:hypothetical protein
MQVIYEQLSGHRVGWKKALHYLTEHFSGVSKIGKQANQPIILLIDELDLLLTRNQSVIIQTEPLLIGDIVVSFLLFDCWLSFVRCCITFLIGPPNQILT